MLEYPKIETLFNRNPDFSVNLDSLRRPEFGLVKSWVLTEKIDGTNIRIIFDRARTGEAQLLGIYGRTDNAQIPAQLFNNLNAMVKARMEVVSGIMERHDLETYVLYGEGYGPGIQNGGGYSDVQKFILFDVMANGAWLDIEQVKDTCSELDLDMVHMFSYTTIDAAVEMCREGLPSYIPGVHFSKDAEGVVAKTHYPLYDRRGNRLMWKLKTRDFK